MMNSAEFYGGIYYVVDIRFRQKINHYFKHRSVLNLLNSVLFVCLYVRCLAPILIDQTRCVDILGHEEVGRLRQISFENVDPVSRTVFKPQCFLNMQKNIEIGRTIDFE